MIFVTFVYSFLAHSMSNPVVIVWFKRDLRVQDHAALYAASRQGPVLPLYVIEPGLWQQPDMSQRHWRFIRPCLFELRHRLANLGQPLIVREGAAEQVLGGFVTAHRVTAVFSHQETGNNWTYARDRRVTETLRGLGVPWHELPQNGVIRGLIHRDGWATRWERRMAEPVSPVPEALMPIQGIEPGFIPKRPSGMASSSERQSVQAGGTSAGEAILNSFLQSRGRRYSGGISSPLTAWNAGSRLSPHLAWGTLSIRQVVQSTRARRLELREGGSGEQRNGWMRSLRAFEERLHWHCHFMQKLESQPDIEFRNMHRACDGLREEAFSEARFQAWCRGETGFPLVDACMRALCATGWLNFRMRAMLVSFAAYQLWLHWRQPALHLARQFTDYEPGIHYCQLQMQSGTTGINALRIYNPVKQSLDQDPEGHFIRRWVPELRAFPDRWIHEPWKAPVQVQEQAGCTIGEIYPAPIVEHEQAAREARSRFMQLRRGSEANAEADRIRSRHGSRRRQPRPRRPSAQPSPQQELFD